MVEGLFVKTMQKATGEQTHALELEELLLKFDLLELKEILKDKPLLLIKILNILKQNLNESIANKLKILTLKTNKISVLNNKLDILQRCVQNLSSSNDKHKRKYRMMDVTEKTVNNNNININSNDENDINHQKYNVMDFNMSNKFVVIFEKNQFTDCNALLCCDINLKSNTFKNNEVWQSNPDASYCIYEKQSTQDCIVYRVGGQSNKSVPNIEYSMSTDSYNVLPSTQIKRWGLSVVYNENHGLVVSGGYSIEQRQHLSTVEIFSNKHNNTEKKWKYLPSMNKKHHHCSSITIENKLFVFGGYNDDESFLSSNEMYDFNNINNVDKNNNTIMKSIFSRFTEKNDLKWKNIARMKYGKKLSGVKYFKNTNQIFLIGGINSDKTIDTNISKTFFVYDVSKNEFIEFPNTLEEHQWKPGIIIDNNDHTLIYAVGNNGTLKNSWGIVECYDTRAKKWFYVSELNKILNNNNDCKDNEKKNWFQSVSNCN